MDVETANYQNEMSNKLSSELTLVEVNGQLSLAAFRSLAEDSGKNKHLSCIRMTEYTL